MWRGASTAALVVATGLLLGVATRDVAFDVKYGAADPRFHDGDLVPCQPSA